MVSNARRIGLGESGEDRVGCGGVRGLLQLASARSIVQERGEFGEQLEMGSALIRVRYAEEEEAARPIVDRAEVDPGGSDSERADVLPHDLRTAVRDGDAAPDARGGLGLAGEDRVAYGASHGRIVERQQSEKLLDDGGLRGGLERHSDAHDRQGVDQTHAA